MVEVELVTVRLFPAALRNERRPVLEIEKRVVVAVSLVEDEMMKAKGLLIEVEARKIERLANGEVVPIPTLPSKVVVENLEVEEAKIPCTAKSGVDVAEVLTPKFSVGVNGNVAETCDGVA